MDKPIITWYVKNAQSEYINRNIYYAGNYCQDDAKLIIPIRIWNNRYGTTAVSDLKKLKLNLFFSYLEDAVLLQYISVATQSVQGDITIAGKNATVVFPEDIILSGKVNNGDDKEYAENYVDIFITFDASKADSRLKEHDLKNLYITIVDE